MNRPARGYGLFELLCVCGISALVLGFALPTFTQVLDQSRVAAVHNELIASLGMARQEAIRSRAHAMVCPLDAENGRCAAGGDWSSGWLTFIDRNGNRRLDSNERVLVETGQTLPDKIRIYSGPSRPAVRYAPNGMSIGSNLTIRVCLHGEARTAIILNNAGRPRIERDPAALANHSCPDSG